MSRVNTTALERPSKQWPWLATTKRIFAFLAWSAEAREKAPGRDVSLPDFPQLALSLAEQKAWGVRVILHRYSKGRGFRRGSPISKRPRFGSTCMGSYRVAQPWRSWERVMRPPKD